MSELTLYYFPSCPYCQKVLRCLERKKINVILKNTRENEAYRQELVKAGGKSQVPCLVIDGKPLYESDDIVNWLNRYDAK